MLVIWVSRIKCSHWNGLTKILNNLVAVIISPLWDIVQVNVQYMHNAYTLSKFQIFFFHHYQLWCLQYLAPKFIIIIWHFVRVYLMFKLFAICRYQNTWCIMQMVWAINFTSQFNAQWHFPVMRWETNI